MGFHIFEAAMFKGTYVVARNQGPIKRLVFTSVRGLFCRLQHHSQLLHVAQTKKNANCSNNDNTTVKTHHSP